MDMHSISVLKATMPAVLKGLKERRRPVMVVNNGRPQAVLQEIGRAHV